MTDWINKIHVGDALDVLKRMPDGLVQCVVTSPPYWGLRDYGTGMWEGGDPDHVHETVSARNGRGGSGSPGKQTVGAFPSSFAADECSCGARHVDRQIGLEKTPEEYVDKMVAVFREVWRVLRDDGIAWINLGDGYSSGDRSTRFRLRSDLTPEQVAYVLEELAKHFRMISATIKGVE